MRTELRGEVLVVELDAPYRCLSSAVLGGGLREVRSWVNAQVPPGYARTDPETHLAEIARRLRVPPPVVGMLTAALVADYAEAARGSARAIATVGLRDPLAAASVKVTHAGPPDAGTINVFVLVEVPLTDAALVGAASTAVEAKAQALATAGVKGGGGSMGPMAATGTATDSLCVACPGGPSGSRVRFAGPATRVGADLARAVHDAVVVGAERYAAWCRRNEMRGDRFRIR
ncbi:MAG: adenosylcobinamide amidohydrolase [Actinomycetota bacterium]|jgi:adenosylcobinamide amidohydrolase|nr:adenosylcobinamide amidohydrolase [Actinomycetota bacterium]